ncbi:MAG TPA: hypothetical protein VIH85_24110 [Solirubrobacteraceae bacterium]
MSFFEVSPGSLSEASALLSAPELGLLGCGGAAAETPVAGVWSEFVDAADRVSRDASTGLTGLSRGLGLAGRAYEIADQSSARSFGP